MTTIPGSRAGEAQSTLSPTARDRRSGPETRSRRRQQELGLSLVSGAHRPAPTEKPGRVVLLGAGPGDPELITVRGLKRLKAADVVLHDRLVDRRLLKEARPQALKIDVGKKPHRPAHTQEEIHGLLLAHARRGRVVVRLKGGDPFVFGRGGEEAIACAEAGISCEVVPGLSSALAAPSALGIPLTHRGIASSFVVLSGHSAAGDDNAWQRDLAAAAGVDTLVILMAASRLEAVCRQLIAAGRGSETPAAVVERATWQTQKSAVGTLASIPTTAQEADIRSPATLIVGPTVTIGLTLSTTLGVAQSVEAPRHPLPRPESPPTEPIALAIRSSSGETR